MRTEVLDMLQEGGRLKHFVVLSRDDLELLAQLELLSTDLKDAFNDLCDRTVTRL